MRLLKLVLAPLALAVALPLSGCGAKPDAGRAQTPAVRETGTASPAAKPAGSGAAEEKSEAAEAKPAAPQCTPGGT